jgi:PcfJ-like protein
VSSDHFARHHRLQLGRCLSLACARLAGEPAREVFDRLLQTTRARAPRILEAPVHAAHHPGVEALVQLARVAPSFRRTSEGWSSSGASWQGGVHALAQHLLCAHPVPAFLGAAWYATDDPFADAKRRWFVAHGTGASLRSLDLPIRLTRRMEHLALKAPAHVSIELALRRAELVGLGSPPALADAVLAARPAQDLRHGAFWRSAWHFLNANAGAIPLDQVGPIVDFLHAVRHEHVDVHTTDGIVRRPPPQPDFSLRGRTAASVLRLMDAWHRGLASDEGDFRWHPSGLRPMVIEMPSEDPERPPTTWEIVELTTSGALRAEGHTLHHCVASYAGRCRRGESQIFSIRRHGAGSSRSMATVEVDPRRRSVVQARAVWNRLPSGKALRLLHAWAAREGVRVAAM